MRSQPEDTMTHRVPSDAPGDTILDVRGLKMYFSSGRRSLFRRDEAVVKAVDDVSFTIGRGQTLGLVGESGCGKSTIGACILQLYKPTAGNVFFEGADLTKMPRRQLQHVRRQIQVIFQDPFSSLDPRMRADRIISEPLVIHKLVKSAADRRAQVAELLTAVGLEPYMASRYPHEFSGGQRQRIAVARALAIRPSFIVCDEAVSALDVSVQAQVVNLLEELQEQFGLTYLFIAHDLSVVRHIADRVAIMYLGHIVEIGNRNEVFGSPLHPYTEALISAAPVPDPVKEAGRHRIILTGEVPSSTKIPPGCVFHTRCPIAIEDCKAEIPMLKELRPEHWVACIRAGES
jgi:oligopeptide transport system ATP-binding protein